LSPAPRQFIIRRNQSPVPVSATNCNEHQGRLEISAGHPSLPGHFPGRPIVPGVVLLDAVLDSAQRWLGRPVVVTGMPVAKFMSPLLPGQPAELRLELAGCRLDFVVTAGTRMLAKGRFRLQPDSP
jgi:3-hydroxymyristoyl/3-hydroxydecanoyl-(acyl carrier protein) dehydratase